MEEDLVTNIYFDLLEYSGLYAKNVVQLWGENDPHWFKAKWSERELSLRHDMVCILLCNLETLTPLDMIKEYLEGPPPKKRRIGEEEEAAYESKTSSGGTIPLTNEEAEEERAEETQTSEDMRRYLLIEGMPSESEMISRICEKEGVPHPQQAFDIFDKKEKKWIEVKVTQSFLTARSRYRATIRPGVNTGFIHIHPLTSKVTRENLATMPGEGKACKFLMERAAYIESRTRMPESSLFEEESIEDAIFCCDRFNKASEEWVSSWWDCRKQAEVTVRQDILKSMPNKLFRLSELAASIENTSIREAPYMKLKAKLLPPAILTPMTTELEEDEQLVNLFLEELEPIVENEWGTLLRTIKEVWFTKQERSTFRFMERGECEHNFPQLAHLLGVGAKGTVKNDACGQIKQPEFEGYPDARYHPWLAELLKELALPHHLDTSFARHLHDVFHLPQHPVAQEMQEIRRKFFRCLGESRIGEYCSVIKNFYSRMGGAYCERTQKGAHNRIAIFPLYSVGSDDEGKKLRRMTGICIRGPFHAKQATDRIPFITIERSKVSSYGGKFLGLIHKANLVDCTNGTTLVVRQNAILKQDPSYLAFSYNAAYLSANFMGEVFLQSETALSERSCMHAASSFLETCGPWLMERVSESVYMAITGGSQEEGAFAIVRKIYMAVLGHTRGLQPHSRDWKGLAEALNECLRDSAFALYWGEQTRRLLQKLSDSS